MKFFIDAQLPKSIGAYFHNCDCMHASELKKGNLTKDSVINKLSIKEERAVITKDIDFYYSYVANRKPYKLVLVKFGNIRLSALKTYFNNNSEKIIELLKIHSFIILEKNRIRILD